MRLLIILFLLFSFTSLEAKIAFPLTHEPIDVVIPSCDKDLETLELCIKYAKKHVVNIRRIIVVSEKKLTNSAEWFDEGLYPFTKWDVARNLIEDEIEAKDFYENGGRIGWYYQQLLKLYVHLVIPELSSNVLLLDSDTIFLKNVKFLNSKAGALFNISKENHSQYYVHMNKLVSGLEKNKSTASGITHHMLIQRPIILDLVNTIETAHRLEAWKAFCKCVDENNLFAGASEYEIYFNYALTHTNQVEIRKLKWRNIRNLKDVKKYKKRGYHYVSCHAWSRR